MLLLLLFFCFRILGLYDNLMKLFSKSEKKIKEQSEELKKNKTVNDMLIKENNLNKKTIQKISTEKNMLEKTIEENKKHISKIENKVKMNKIITEMKNSSFIKYITSSVGYLLKKGIKILYPYIIFELAKNGDIMNFIIMQGS